MKYNFKHLNIGDFIFDKSSFLTNSYLKEEILKKNHAPNTVIFFNDKIIYNSVKEALILKTDLSLAESETNENELAQHNKINLNAFLHLKTKENIDYGNVKLVFAFCSNTFLNVIYEFSKGCKIKLFQKFLSFNNAKISCFATYKINNNSTVNSLLYKNLSENSVFFQKGEIKGDFNLTLMQIGEKKSIESFDFHLLKKDAKCAINTYVMANKKAESYVFTDISHNEHDTLSQINNFAILNDFAKVSFDGNTNINSKNKNSDAKNQTKVINLYKGKAFVCPKLVINEFDTKASHNFTLSTLNPDYIYYLSSRGISKNKACELLLLSHFNFLENWVFAQRDILKVIKGKIKRRNNERTNQKSV